MLKRLKKNALSFLQAQLIATLVSLPILVAWGMPISKASLLGNLIFWPILTIFLILSSIIFFTEILSIPNGFFIDLLNLVTNFWQRVLDWGRVSWLTGFAKPAVIILFFIFVVTFLVLSYKKIKTINIRICILSLLLIISSIFLSGIQVLAGNKNLNYQDKLFISSCPDGRISITDYGIFKRKRAIDKFLDFELKPYIIKNFGTLRVKEFDLKCDYRNRDIIENEFRKIFQM